MPPMSPMSPPPPGPPMPPGPLGAPPPLPAGLAPTPQLPTAPPPMPPMAPPPPPKYHDVKIVIRKSYACAKVCGVPPEEFGIARDARSIRDCGYCFHEVIKTESQLIDCDYDVLQVQALPSYTISENIESIRRDTVDEGSSKATGDSGVNSANRPIRITEHYVRMNYEGKKNGKAKLYRVTTGGELGVIMKRNGKEDIEEVEEIPFAAMTPVIVTHRFFGRSIADLVMDIQRIKTALVRGALDNLYAHNNPRAEIAEQGANENTLDDYLTSRHGGMIRVKTPGTIAWQVVPDITASVYPALQYMDATREWRTGVSRQGQGVDPNALQNQVATIANQMAEAAQAKTKLIARIFAETGIKDMFLLLHGLIRKNGSQAETVRLRNEWVDVDPRDWKERNDLTINVGLGSGSKAQQLAGLQILIGAQKEALAAGMISAKNLWESAKELTKLLGHKDVDRFFTQPGKPTDPADPAAAPITPPDPNAPEIAKMEKQAEIEKLQALADITTKQADAQAQAARDDRKLAQESQLEERRFELEKQLKLIDAEIAREKHAQAMLHDSQKHDQAMANAAAKAQSTAQPAPAPQQPSILPEIGTVVAKLGDHLSKSHEALLGAIKAPARKRIRKNADGSWESEILQ